MRAKPPTFNRWYNTRSGDAPQIDRPRFVRHRAYQPNPEGYTLTELIAYIVSCRSIRQSDSITRQSLREGGVPADSINEAFTDLDNPQEADEAFDPYGD